MARDDEQPQGPDPEPQPAARAKPKRRRRLWFGLLVLIPALAMTGAAGAFWTGYRLYDQPFVWYNTNRIAATDDRASRGMGSPIIVALGGAGLRHATLDEEGMASLVAKQGIERSQFLRIVHDHAQFADFEPMLGAILKAKPDLVLIDLDLLFAERRPFADLRRYATVLRGVATEGKPYLPDQIALQYDKPCRPANPDGTTRDDVDRRVEALRSVVALNAGSSAYDRVRRFADEARAAGTRVALLQLRRPALFEERLYGPGNTYLPDALARLNGQAGLPIWHFPETVHKTAYYCRSGALGPEGRKAYSAWLAAGIAQVLSQPPVEEAALR